MRGKFLKFFAILVSVLTLFSSFTFADNGKGTNAEPSPYDSDYINEVEKAYDITQKTDNKSQNSNNNQVNSSTGNNSNEQTNSIDDALIEKPNQAVNNKTGPNLETVNNYYIGTFRLYDESTGKIYDFQANKAFTYDYKKKNPTLKVDEWSFKVFTKQIEDYFSENVRDMYYPKQIAGTNKYTIEKVTLGKKTIDKDKFKSELSRRIKIADYSIVKIPFVKSTVNTKDIASKEVVLLSKYSTNYNASDWARSENIMMAGKEINGTKLKHGESFRYNQRIKPISKNLKVAKIILNNEFVDGVGGGLCQVSTTLFNAALEAGLQIDFRSNHTLPISYVPRGRDAMVSDYSDFVFSNSLANDVYITYTKEYTGNITFSVYGKKTDKLSPKIWVEGGGLTYTLYRQIGSKIDKFSSYYSKPKQ